MKQAFAAALLTVVFLTIPSTSYSAVYYVPDDYSTIQLALNNVVNGDTIIVRDGTHSGAGFGDIDFMNKAVTLMSENGPGSCTIDATGANRGFVFWRGETSTSVVDGFTIVGGNTGYGAGIYIENSSPTIMNCVITNCSATAYGGGLSLGSSSSSLVNLTIVVNAASTGGGGIACFNSNPDITHCTIGDNSTVSGGGLYCYNSSPAIVNSIFWSDSASDGDEIWLLGSSVASVSYSDVDGGRADISVNGGATLNWGAGNLDRDPKFVGGGDYHIAISSPCVDKGMNAGVSVDIDDDPRPFGSGYDMGSDETTELPSALTTIHLVSPADGSVLSDPPTFVWSADGGTLNQYSIDYALTPFGPFIFSSWDRLRLEIFDENISTNPLLWAGLPSGSKWYWRVRGADTGQLPLTIITSDEVWSFTKQ